MWSPCSKTCGGGTTSRDRDILSVGIMCDFRTTETELCNPESCESMPLNYFITVYFYHFVFENVKPCLHSSVMTVSFNLSYLPFVLT